MEMLIVLGLRNPYEHAVLHKTFDIFLYIETSKYIYLIKVAIHLDRRLKGRGLFDFLILRYQTIQLLKTLFQYKILRYLSSLAIIGNDSNSTPPNLGAKEFTYQQIKSIWTCGTLKLQRHRNRYY